jgi:phosphoribosylformylglycinamidine synthase
MDAKRAGDLLVLVGTTVGRLGGSHLQLLTGASGGVLPVVDLVHGPRAAQAVHAAITAGCVLAAHDLSEGGLLLAAAEMAFAGDLGLDLDLRAAPGTAELTPTAIAFAEDPSRYLLEVAPERLADLTKALGSVPHAVVGTFVARGTLRLVNLAEKSAVEAGHEVSIGVLRQRWSSGGW